MQDFATATAEATLGAAALLDKLKVSGKGLRYDVINPLLFSIFGEGGAIDKLRAEGRKAATQKMGTPGAISGKSLTGAAYFAAQKKADAEALKIASRMKKIEQDRLNNLKKIATEAAKKLALDKASAFLNQANKLFDIDRIQLTAAAMAKQTEEDYVRIRLKTNILELEDAINEGNVQSAAKFASLITQDAQLLGKLRGLMVGLGDIPNPFAEWLATLEKMLAILMAVPMVKPVTTYTPNFQPFTPAPGGYEGFGSGLSDMGIGNYGGLAGAGRYGGGGAPVINVVVNNAGSTITERDLVDTITQGIYNNQAAGIPINYSTVY
jgi:hypothetical protein